MRRESDRGTLLTSRRAPDGLLRALHLEVPVRLQLRMREEQVNENVIETFVGRQRCAWCPGGGEVVVFVVQNPFFYRGFESSGATAFVVGFRY